jgi:uncharacterized protein
MKRLAIVAALVLSLPQIVPAGAQPARNFIWKISGQTGAVYLVGSVHLLRKDYYPLSPALDAAFQDSNLLVEEADLGELDAPASQFKMLTRGLLPEGQSLDRILSPATLELVGKRVLDLGLPIEPLLRFKPWMLALTLVELEWQKAGFDATLGLDRHFYERARIDGKSVQGLETIDYQLSLFDEMTKDEQDRMLAESLTDLDKEQASVLTLVNAWKAGDTAAVGRIVLADMNDDPPLYERLIVNRNRNWQPKLEALLTRSGHAFVVVGAAHIVGPNGLLAMFAAKGYKVEQL